MANIIFIGGTGRSGTTVVRKILERHSQVVALPFESRFISDPDGIVDFYRVYTANWSPYLADRRIKRLEAFLLSLAKANNFHKFLNKMIQVINKRSLIISPKAYADWELEKYIPNFEKYVRELISELYEFTFPAIWRGTEGYTFSPKIYYGKPKSKEEVAKILRRFLDKVVQSLFQKKKGVKLYVDDSPWNILIAKDLFSLIPDTKIINVLRDPRDITASFLKQNWSPKTLKEAVAYCKDVTEDWLSFKKELPLDQYLEIKLEDLVSFPEVTARKICDFISLPYENQMIELDLSKSHSGRWQQEFSDEEKKYLEDQLGSIIKKLGYE